MTIDHVFYMWRGLRCCPYMTDGHKSMGDCGCMIVAWYLEQVKLYHPFRVSWASIFLT